MENIPLRAYNREIDQLIDNNRSQDALHHCEQILGVYPRCLETSRLKGKAYLELQQYDQSEETFQKVLASFPDDFTANLGMSLLREKQKDLNGTIWHMERAYEAQPSNTAVQTELRRLYQQRDGVETSRIRLTRGALVRMYIRGDLIPQALNEIQAILHEDPSRIDIQILQSIAFLKAGKKDEALQNCRDILQELPYCFEANRILFENTPASTRIEDAQNYQQCLRELDPYYEFTSIDNPDPQKVPEEEVKIKISDEFPLQKSSVKREEEISSSAFEIFARNPPVDTFGNEEAENKKFEAQPKNPPEEEKPAWLEGIEIASFQQEMNNSQSDEPIEESSEPMTTTEPTPPEELPDHLEESADQPSESSIQANPFLTSSGNQIPVAEPGDIPEWLRALASEPPAASSDAITAPLRVPGETGVLQTGEENLDFLRNIPGEPQSTLDNPPEIPERRQNLTVESLPGILPADPFLVSSESTQPIPLEEDAPEKISPARDMPEWLKSVAENTAKPAPIDEFGQKFAVAIPQVPENEPSFSVDDLQLSNDQQTPSVPESKLEDGSPTPEVEQYLEQLRKDISPGDQPEWLQKDNLGSDIEALFEKEKNPPDNSPPSDPETNWMTDLRKEDFEQPIDTSDGPPISVPNIPDWLFTSETDTDEEDTAPIQLEPPVTSQPTPDWMKDVKSDIFSKSEIDESLSQATAGEDSADSEMLNFLDRQPAQLGDEKPGAIKDQANDFNFFESQSADFLQTNQEPLEDNLSPSGPFPTESLPADLAALLRDDSDKNVHTNPLLEDEPVTQTFTPSDFFTSSEFQSDQVLDENQPEAESPLSKDEIAAGDELQQKSEVFLDSVEPENVPPVEIAYLKETGPVIPAEEIQPLEPVMASETANPEDQAVPVKEFLSDIVKEESPTLAVDEKPVIQSIPEEKPFVQPVADEEPVTQSVPQIVPAVQIVPKEKPVSKPKRVAPIAPPTKTERAPEIQKVARKIEKINVQPVQKPGAGAADLARARESVARGDLITALRRYIKLVNANKSLDHVSSDLKDMVRKNPKNYLAWQTYGDARLRSNRIQEALDAYAKAADLLK